MPLRARNVTLALLVLLTAALALSACGPQGPAYVDSGATYTKASVSSVLDKVDITKYAKQSAADVTTLRHDALTGLRRRGGDASKAADLLTATFGANTRGVPVYVEWASLDGQHALILVEAIGPAKGSLTTKRLWALSDSGDVLFVATK
jgi:predicted small lipoprotein YifL